MNAIDPRAILNGIDLVLLEPNIVCVNQTESTNALARIMVERGLGEGLVVIADLQTQGRGRHSRTWHSPLGGLYFSIVLKPRIADENAPLLGFLTACAIATGLHEVLGLEVSLKWPNDILVGERKLGGILSETVSTNGSLLVVIGVGINQNAKREDLPAEIQDRSTTILSEIGRETSKENLISAIISGIDSRLGRVGSDLSFSTILDEWVRHSSTIGRSVRIHDGSDIIEGLALGIGPDGSLEVEDSNGQLRRILIGDIAHL
ncbi:MAG: biotin--[acetyl-CoA-carboxylase] ligase [Candidatus Thorarchaeota archaeon]|nr:biotin--[acetyl-CoA-carboxylase] ligase [Candidatus Thorarchaeota archaeon]